MSTQIALAVIFTVAALIALGCAVHAVHANVSRNTRARSAVKPWRADTPSDVQDRVGGSR